MSQELERRTPQQELVAVVRDDRFKREVALVLRPDVTPDAFARVLSTAILNAPDIAKLERQSVLRAAIRVAEMGLLPDGREAAIVGFGGRAQAMPMIGGLRKIAGEHGWTLNTRVVYTADEFDHVLGLREDIMHRPTRPGVERGPLVAAYAVATHRDGRQQFEVMYAEDVEKVRRVSRAKDSGPWKDWPERMWEKTVGRRLFAKLALDPNDKRVRTVLATPDDPEQAEDALYGDARALPPGVDPETGEVFGEGDGVTGPSGDSAIAATPPAVGNDAGPSPSPDEPEIAFGPPLASQNDKQRLDELYAQLDTGTQHFEGEWTRACGHDGAAWADVRARLTAPEATALIEFFERAAANKQTAA